MIQPIASPPSSSPSTASPGRSCSIRARSVDSTRRSASETGVRSGFVSTREVGGAEARHRDRVGVVGEGEREREVVVGLHAGSLTTALDDRERRL